MNVKITGPNGSSIFEAGQIDYDKRRRTLRMATGGVFGPDHLLEAGVSAYVTNSAGETIAKYEGWSAGSESADKIQLANGEVASRLENRSVVAMSGVCGTHMLLLPVTIDGQPSAVQFVLQVGAATILLDEPRLQTIATRGLVMIDPAPAVSG